MKKYLPCHDPAIIARFWPKSCHFCPFLSLSVTFLVVTAINTLTLGIRGTCIILRHIWSWFEAVLDIAIPQSCAWGGPKSQSGLRGSKMIQNDHYNMFLTIWRHFGPIWTLLNHFRLNLIFCSKSLWPKSSLSFWGKKLSFVWNDPKESKWVQNGPKWSKTCYIDHLGLFWTLFGHWQDCHVWPFLVPKGPLCT